MAERRRGFFISLEGGDGAGKSTQVKRLAEYLRSRGHSVVVTREPGGSPGAEAIRALFVRGAAERWSVEAEALMMCAARADHLDTLIRPALGRGDTVITDRFADSTTAYQGVAGGLGEEAVARLNALVVKDNEPDLTIVLDIAPHAARSRADARASADNRFENKGAAYQEKVRQAFLKIARANPRRCVVVDASKDEDAVFVAVAAAVDKALQSRR